MRYFVCASSIAILALSSFPTRAAEPTGSDRDKLSAGLTAEVDGPLLAGLPLQLKLTITNTGKAPLEYWDFPRDGYPCAGGFVAAVTDASGHTRRYRLHNSEEGGGGGSMGSPDYTRKITATQVLPAACDPLAPGIYSVAVSRKRDIAYNDGEAVLGWPAMSAKPLAIKIKDDPPAVAAAERDLMARAEKEPFARHVVQVYAIDPLVKTRLLRFLNDDPEITSASFAILTHIRRLPAGGEAMLRRLASKYSNLKPSSRNNDRLFDLGCIASNIGTDGAMEAVLVVARSNADAYARTLAVGRLGEFRQKKADAELLTLIAKKDTPVYSAAVYELADRRNPAALEPLLRAFKDKDKAFDRCVVVGLLSRFRTNPAARDVLTAALQDPDPLLRTIAKIALEADAEDEDD